jgi:P-type E1-E2 ATPase
MPFSPKTPAPMIGTFAMVLVFTSFKELYEDIGRWKSDREVNNKKTLILDKGKWVKTDWKDVKVGDTLKVLKDEDFPADLLLISSEKDLVFVDTMNLDGETNLKERLIPF